MRSPVERYAVGTLISGRPLEGASLDGVVRAAQDVGLSAFPEWFIRDVATAGGIVDEVSLGTRIAESFRFSESTFREMLKNLSDHDAKLALPAFFNFVRPIRRFVHRAAIAECQRNQSTNPLTLFGNTQRSLEQSFRDRGAPNRITPSQLLALFIGVVIIGDVLFRYADRLATVALNVAKRLGLRPPTDDQKLVPFAYGVAKRVFGSVGQMGEPFSNI